MDTDADSLKGYFAAYGEVVDSVVMTDPHTKKPRGFGFITYKEQIQAQSCLDSGPHVVDNKPVGGGWGEWWWI
jgi:heterogeneous nuclear ribonucleoprotein A1/A3